MSFPRYPKYKASGIEWLGDVPEGWTVRPLKTVASGTGTLFIDGDWIESKDISSAGIRYLTSGNVGEGFYKEQGQGFITDETFNELKCTEVLPGDLLISRLNIPIGRACIVPDLGSRIVTCVDNVVVRPASNFNRRFCVFLLSCKGHLENTEILGRGATMPRLSRSALGRLPFAFPPFPEQTAIAEFLDRETGKIDELVAEQRRLMELLKEKRQAVISHAVTKGLNPHAPMKPSGIEWLGDVPEGWTVRPLKTVASGTGTLFIDGDWIESKDISSAGIRYLTSGNVGEGFYKEQGQGFITDETFNELKCTEVLPGDLLISRLNIPIGRACIVPDLGSRIVTCVDNVVVRPASNFNRRFCVFLLSCKGHLENTEILGRGATMPRLSRSALGRLPFAFPPFPEQTAIAEFLEVELAKFDTLTAEAQRAIDLLQERRTALISAAVTGQIDVRQQSRN